MPYNSPVVKSPYIRYVGVGGNYPTIAAALADQSATSRIFNRQTQTETITKTNGSTTITGAGTTWRNTSGTGIGVGDLAKFGTDTRYYMVKRVDSNTQIILEEPYQGATVGPSSQAWTTNYLKRLILFLVPGIHYVDGTVVTLYPGVDIVGSGIDSSFIQEITFSTVFAFTSDNRISHVTFSCEGPDSTWGDMDGISGGTLATLWGGAKFELRLSKIVRSNLRSSHANGDLRLPIIYGGTATYSNLDIYIDGPGSFVGGGTVVVTNANTTINMSNISLRRVLGHDITLANTGVSESLLRIGELGTYNLYDVNAVVPESNTNPFLSNVSAIYAEVPCVLNMSNVFVSMTNTSGTTENTYGLELSGSPTVNISHSSIEAAGTGACGLYVNGATVNVRAGCRIKGTTNSINCAAGTVNVSGNADLIGLTTGVGIINLLTPT